jgi:cation:H+ antiporter
MDFADNWFAALGGGWWFAFSFLLIGFSILVFSADFFVENSGKVAKIFGVPEIVIGLTVVAVGTSLPETAVSITAALNGSAGIAVGNAIGSNILNILIILGICSLVCPLYFMKCTLKYEMPFMILITAFTVFYGQFAGQIDILCGIILLFFFAVYCVYLFWQTKIGSTNNNAVSDTADKNDKPKQPKKNALEIIKCLVFILLGLVGIVLGSTVGVTGAKGIATAIGISDRIIGLTVVGFGTSLPELVTSVVAVKKGYTNLAVGNIVGSDIFNLLLVLGITAVISPIPLLWNGVGYLIDGITVLLSVVILFIFSIIGGKLTRTKGIMMLLIYAVYLTVILML